MKKILIFFYLLTLCNISFAWPDNMYTIERLFYDQFSSMRTYINNLKINYPFKIKDNSIIFYADNGNENQVIFRIYLQIFRGHKSITEKLIFVGENGHKEKFVYTRLGNNLKPLPFDQLVSFRFSFPNNVDYLSIEFERSKVYQKIDFGLDSVRSHYRLYDYGLEIHHFEQINDSNLYSKLWYQCDVCTGEPLIAIMDTREIFYGNIQYMLGNPLQIIGPKKFYAKANRSYLSGINKEFTSIVDNAIMEFGWPVD